MDSPKPATPDTPIDTTTLDVIGSQRRLSVPAVAVMLGRGNTQAEIGRAFGVSRQAVHDYINMHSEELSNIKDYDSVMAAAIKQATLRIIDSLDSDDIKKAGLVGKFTGLGIGIEKVRLIEGKSTQNISSITRLCQELEDKRRPQDIDNPSNKRTDGGDEGDNA